MDDYRKDKLLLAFCHCYNQMKNNFNNNKGIRYSLIIKAVKLSNQLLGEDSQANSFTENRVNLLFILMAKH